MTTTLRLFSLAALIAGFFTVNTAQAVSILVDTFDQGSASISRGNAPGVEYDNYTGAGPLGGTRFAAARAGSGTASNIEINNGSYLGVAYAFRNNTNSALRQIGWGKSGLDFDADFSSGTELNLNLGDNGTIEIDVQEVENAWANYPQLRIWANNGTEKFEYNLYSLFAGMQTATAVPQTLSVQLNAPSFGTFNSGDLDNIDGIRLVWYDRADTIISEVRATDGVVPEPSSMVLAGLGLIGLAGWGVRRRRK